MKLTESQLAQICRGLALLLHAGISLADSLFLLAKELEPQLEPLAKTLGQHMDQGTSLSCAMEESEAFPAAAVGMVRVGERTGRMEETLSYLADFYEEQAEIRCQIKNALTYPSILFLLMLLVLGVLLMEVLPVFDQVYGSLGSGLTGAAGGLMYLGSFLKKGMPVLAGLLVLVLLGAGMYRWIPALRSRINAYCLSRLGDRGIAAKYNNALFARAMAMGLAGGMGEEEALNLSHLMLVHLPGAASRCLQCRQMLSQGMDLPQALGQCQLLPASQCRMLALGIRGGSGDRVMEDIADRLSREARQAMEDAVSRLEPAMVLLCAGLVGAILLAVMLPLMDILAAIG